MDVQCVLMAAFCLLSESRNQALKDVCTIYLFVFKEHSFHSHLLFNCFLLLYGPVYCRVGEYPTCSYHLTLHLFYPALPLCSELWCVSSADMSDHQHHPILTGGPKFGSPAAPLLVIPAALNSCFAHFPHTNLRAPSLPFFRAAVWLSYK